MKSQRGAILSLLAGIVLINTRAPLNPIPVMPVSLPAVGVPGVAKAPLHLPGIDVPGASKGVWMRTPGIMEETPASEGLRDMIRKIAHDPVAQDRLTGLFDNARSRKPAVPVIGLQ